MKALLRVCCVVLLISSGIASGVAKGKNSSTAVFKPFVGTWRLVLSQERLSDGTVRPYGFGPRAQGYLMYDATGHVCAQVVNPDRPKWRNPDQPTPEEIRTAFDGFGGYCGTYTVDPGNGTMAHHPEVPFDPNIVGKPSPRNYRFEGNKLIYTGKEKHDGGESEWKMVWERVE